MAQFNHTTVTLAGRRALALAITNKAPLHIVRIEVGKGVPHDSIECLTSLVEKVADVTITKFASPSDGVSLVRGAFRNNDIAEDFRLNEIGVIARVGDGEEALFSYASAGENGDYIPASNGSSLMEKVLTLSLVVGSAEVLFQNIDPNAAMTREDLEDALGALNMDQIRKDIEEAEQSLILIKQEIQESIGGLVKKAGDTMTGKLEAPAFVGQLTGSATQWNEWSLFESIDDLNSRMGSSVNPETASLHDIVAALPVKSKLIASLMAVSTIVPGIGVLEVQKLSENLAISSFSAVDGRMWQGTLSGSSWTGWGETGAIPPGGYLFYEGTVAPLGYVFPHGQTVNRTTYARLFSVIGTRYGAGDGKTTFKLPDFRGQFLRCLDNGRGLDPGRAIGSAQGDAIRNITGGISFDKLAESMWNMEGAFVNSYRTGEHGGNGHSSLAIGQRTYRIDFNAASCGIPIADENRPKNVALNLILKY